MTTNDAPALSPVELLRWSWRQLTSMCTALILLLLLALASVPGSVVPQQNINSVGVSQWRASDRPLVATTQPRILTRGQLVLRGWAINAVNPKGTVFLLAVVPNFLDLSRPLAPQYLVIALSLSFTDLVVMGAYTALASRVLRALNEPHHVRWMNRSFGSLFIVAGSLLAGFRRAT